MFEFEKSGKPFYYLPTLSIDRYLEPYLKEVAGNEGD